MVDVSPVSFNLHVIGGSTGTEYVGTFKVKPILTQAEQLARDAIMRDLLGTNPKDASPRAISQAMLIAEIQIRSVETPEFWKEARNGLNLFDEEVLGVAYDKISEIESTWKKDIKAKAEAAREQLKKEPLAK